MKNRFHRIIMMIIAVVMIITSGCSKKTNDQSQNNTVENSDKGNKKKIVVYASIYPMYDFARNIGRDRIDLRQMVPPGAEPHDWEPSAKLMAEMEKADVFIYNGAGMEPWVDKLVRTVKNDKLIAVETSKGLTLLKGEGHDEEDHDNDHGEYDPHTWVDPLNAVKQSENIKEALIKSDEANKEFYEKNYREFADKLMALDKKYKEELGTLKGKEIVTAHAAFGYLANRYGLKQIPIRGMTPQEEPGPAKMAEITKLLKDKGIKYVFFEALTNPRLSQVLAKEVGAQTAVLNPVGGLTEEDMKSGKDYITVMEENLEVLKKALGE